MSKIRTPTDFAPTAAQPSERLLPLMFHRRLALLVSVVFCTVVLLGARLANLTLVHGEEMRRTAESRLDQIEILPTTRGRILDRNGIVLAQDVPAFDVAVDYPVISGAWVIEQASKAARNEAGASWYEMSTAERGEAILHEQPAFEQAVERLWETVAGTGGIDRKELDERLEAIRSQISLMARTVNDLNRVAHYRRFGPPKPGEKDTFDPITLREELLPQVILPRVSDDVAFEFRRMEGKLPGLHVIDSWRREYPLKTIEVEIDRSTLPQPLRDETSLKVTAVGVADHLLGKMRDQVYRSDVDRKPFRTGSSDGEVDLQGYQPGDSVGALGLEKTFEDFLRGYRGMILKHMNTGEEERTPPRPGLDIRLSLDVRLQARIQASMTPSVGLAQTQQWHAGWVEGAPKATRLPLGTPLKSAAVVLDVDSGDILAMVSMPTIALGETWSNQRREFEGLYVNRTIEAPYPPGSIIKPLVLATAVADGVHRLDDGIYCTGHFYPNWKDVARCWIYREAYRYTTHSASLGDEPLHSVDAIARSCNIYFYTLARELGMDRLIAGYRAFGIGTRFDIGLLQETTTADGAPVVFGIYPGRLPTEERIDELRRTGALEFETISMGIGQGQLEWTPLHAANSYAILARGGITRDPVLVLNDPRERQEQHGEQLDIPARVIDQALEGLRQSITESFGTGHGIRYEDGSLEEIIEAPAVTVWAKTGTAQAPAYPIDSDDDGIADAYIKDVDHAWFVGLVGSSTYGLARPQYAIAVILEYGGSGGRAAGPIANQIVHALQREGYLQ